MTTKITTDNLAPALATAITQGGGPKISNVTIADSSYNTPDDLAVGTSGGYIKILGSGFGTGCQVTIGTTLASSVAFISSSELRAEVSAKAAGSYPIYVTNTDGGTAVRINGLNFSDFPVWSTGSSLGIKFGSFPFDILVAANSDSNVTYSLAPGSSLPSGANLLANGLITGNVFVNNDTTFNFVLIATDQENQNTNSSFSLTISAGSQYPTIEGGTVTTSGNFKIHTFTSSSNLNIIYPGILDSNIWYLIVGGGAGAGGAGGGAGGFLEGNVSIPSSTSMTNVSILVGAGGSGSTNGGNSLISLFPAITSFGGGTGSKFAVPGNGTTYKGDTGGSGGGSGGNSDTGSVTVPGGAGIPGQGNPGGAGYGNGGSPSGGGGGAGGAGGPYGPMVGGVGKQSSISGSSVYYAGGGGGGSYNVGGGTGGLGGGGNGTAGGTPAGSGTANTGGGGGGNGGGAAIGSGGSGVVIIRYRYQ